MRKQWTAVLGILAGLAIGAGFLIRAGKRIEPVEVGRQAPDFRAVNLQSGDTVTLNGVYKNQVVLVNIWATWCAPCRQEMPAMERLYQEFGPKGFRIAAVSIDEGNPKDVLAFAHELGLTFDILHDSDRSIERLYQTTGYPESFLLDKDGTIVKKAIGEHPWSSEANRRIVAQLLGVAVEPVAATAGTGPSNPGG